MNHAFKTTAIAVICAATMAAPMTASAKKYHNDSYVDFAKVIYAQPIVEQVQVSTPRQQCYQEKVVYDRGGYRSKTGTIAGAVIGGAAASAIAKDRHMKGNEHAVATIAGIILGSAIGSDIDHKRRHDDQTIVRYEDRCETVYDTHYEEQVVGYTVKYRYQGRVYTTTTDTDPGKRIKVSVNVNPVF